MRNHRDYEVLDAESLSRYFIPRTSFHWRHLSKLDLGKDRYRLAWRRRIDSEMARSLHAAIVPAECSHVELIWSATFERSLDLVTTCGLWASIVCDYLVKVTGVGDLREEAVGRMPHVDDHGLVSELVFRSLRLNCLTADYAPLWEEMFAPAWQQDAWTREVPSRPLGEVDRAWTMATPLRRDGERRRALVEIDALVAVMLGITAEELCGIYRAQFGVLRKYERMMRFDANDRQVPKDELKEYDKHGSRAELGHYVLPFTPVNREAEMTVAHEEFTCRLATRPPAEASTN